MTVNETTVEVGDGQHEMQPEPPIAFRDETLFVYAGVDNKDGSNTNKKESDTETTTTTAPVPRQSETSTEALLDPPVAISDPYGWLRDEKRENPKIIQYLNDENNYTEAVTNHLNELRETLYNEMISSIQETDYTVPRPDGSDWYYYTRTYKGKSYTSYCRAPRLSTNDSSSDIVSLITWKPTIDNDDDAKTPILPNEEIILDVNALAIDKPYCSIGGFAPSPSHTYIAYSVDFSGDETYQLYVRNLKTGNVIDCQIVVAGTVKWGINDTILFYETFDAAHRPCRVYRKEFNEMQILESSDKPNDDILLFEELNDTFWMGMWKSLDGKYLFIESSSTETAEIHYLDLQSSTATIQCVAKRRTKVLYEIEHRNGYWWISSNVGSLPNMALFVSPAMPNCEDQWQLVTTANTNTPCFDGGYSRSLDSVSCFINHIVASGREGGIPRIWVLSDINNTFATTSVGLMEQLAFPEAAYDVGMGTNKEYVTSKIAISYSSLVTPPQTIEIDLSSRSGPGEYKRIVLKEKAVPGYDKSEYGSERITVTSRDGTTEIPVSIVYKKDTMEKHTSSNQPVPVHLYGYGSYGICLEADFAATRLPLLNRGVLYVIAHIRGGGEMGRTWYEEPNGAKYLCKKNTFFDFIDVAVWLIQIRQSTTPDLLSCEGRSAGGLLIGVSLNYSPELFRVAIVSVPFVDVVPTMIDATIPLTAGEWEEWGNPNEVKYHEYMMEYSPIQNIRPFHDDDAKIIRRYPSCFVTCGLHDPRVPYWEAAKYVATLRHAIQQQQQDALTPRTVCLKCDMAAGHFSASDRYKYYKEKALDYSFLLDQLGIAMVN